MLEAGRGLKDQVVRYLSQNGHAPVSVETLQLKLGRFGHRGGDEVRATLSELITQGVVHHDQAENGYRLNPDAPR